MATCPRGAIPRIGTGGHSFATGVWSPVHNGAVPKRPVTFRATDVPGVDVPNAVVPEADDSTSLNSLTAIRTALFAWWDANARDLPWRFGRTTPWGVLVSEVMSQQTQMSRVVPYWLSWMGTWPDAAALASASTAEVLTAWGRLGYPRRALRLQECAKVVAGRYHDALPATYDELVALPGVGDYTASAVLSFARGQRIPVIDTNIRRVLSRVLLGKESLGGSANREERDLAERVLPSKAPDSATWNQAVMELGALVCTAKAPLCDSCPLAPRCRFLAAGRPGLGERRTRPRQRFQGTNRQVRGKILEALRGMSVNGGVDGAAAGTQPVTATGVQPATAPEVQPATVPVPTLPRDRVEALWGDSVQLDACIASLDEDGLIEIMPDGSLRLPR